MKNIAILLSGKGTNMIHIFQAIEKNILFGFRINVIISDRKCYGIKYKSIKNIPIYLLKRNEYLSNNVHNILLKYNPYVIVLCGFLSILSKNLCDTWKNKIINIHPSLLPKYGGIGMYGNNIHKLVIKNKDTISGATVHYVTKNVDLGKIICQKSCKIYNHDTVISLSKRISIIESRILITSIKNL